MAPPKKHSAAVATYGDHEVISPENKLRKAASKAPYAPGDDPIARAEKALAELSGEFSSWMDTECERLDQARRNVAAGGFTAANKDALFRAAHDIKGEAATFGFPLVALRVVTDEFLMHENRGRPDVLAQIMGPSIAPE